MTLKSLPYPLDIPSILASSPLFPKWYYYNPTTKEERGALGSLAKVTHIPSTNTTECYYGAIDFPIERQTSLWQDFPSCFFFLPQIEIQQTPQTTFLLERQESLPTLFPLPLPEQALILSPPLYTPNDTQWEELCQSSLTALQQNLLEKVVLARKSTFFLNAATDPWNWVAHLRKRCPSTITFAFQIHPSSLFAGSTPETLFTRKNTLLYTEALAGTQPRYPSSEEDLKAKRFLLAAKKERSEVDIVKRFLTERLHPLCASQDLPSVVDCLQTDTVQHLHYPIHAILYPHVEDKMLLQALHPTPATCGYPREKALAYLAKQEPFDRGLYAGAFGWISSTYTNLCVPIRSALIQQHALHAFSGVGIVPHSTASQEWEELNEKISHWRPIYARST